MNLEQQVQQQNLNLGTYEGWVAWIGDTPLFEAVPWQPDLLQLAPGAPKPQYRSGGRNTIEWDDLPHEKVTELELYFARDRFPNQPVVRLSRPPGAALRWIQLKVRSIQVRAAVLDPRAPDLDASPQRTAVQAYRVGYYDPARPFPPGEPHWRTAPTLIVEVSRTGEIEQHPCNGHPCWPKPHGLGLAPHVLGLEAQDVPPIPGGGV